MILRTHKTTGLFVLVLMVLLAQPQSPAAAVVVFDRVTSVGRPVFVKAVTRGLLFTKGGRRVAIRIDDGPAYETLSGADGAAFMKYHPDRPGLRSITAVSEGEEGSGSILVLKPDEAVIVIGVEGGLQKSLFPEDNRERTREVVTDLSRSYRLVYLTRWIGADLVRDWLEKYRFPPSVVLRWRGESTFKQLERNGVRVEALVGSGALLQSAPDSIRYRFTFDDNDAEAVDGWEDIRKALQGGGDQSKPPASPRKKDRPEP